MNNVQTIATIVGFILFVAIAFFGGWKCEQQRLKSIDACIQQAADLGAIAPLECDRIGRGGH